MAKAKKSKKTRATPSAVRHASGTRVRAQRAPAVATEEVPVVVAEVVPEVEVRLELVVADVEVGVVEEHRASQRVAVAVEIDLASDSQFFSGLSGDISEGGLFLSTYRSLPVGSVVDLEFSLPGSEAPLRARGEVRWLREHATGQPRGVGIAFDELADEDRESIHRFCTMRPPLYYEDLG